MHYGSLASSLIVSALLIVAVFNAALAYIVARASAKEENRVFAVTATSVAVWTLTNAMFRLASIEALAKLWAQFSYVAALLTAASFLHFSWVYPSYPRRQPVLPVSKRMVYTLAVCVAALAFLPGVVIQGVDVGQGRIYTANGIYLIALYMVVTSVLAFVLFYRSQSRLRSRARTQARYVLYGSVLTAIIGLSFNLFLPLWGNYQWVWLGPLGSVFFVFFCVYSIVVEHLFDVRLLIRRTLVYSVLLAMLAGAFAALEKSLEHIVSPLLNQGNTLWTDTIAALLVGFAVDPLKRQLHQWVTSHFFKGENEDR